MISTVQQFTPEQYRDWVYAQVVVDTYTAINEGWSPEAIRASDHIPTAAAELDRAGQPLTAEVYFSVARRAQEDVLAGRTFLGGDVGFGDHGEIST